MLRSDQCNRDKLTLELWFFPILYPGRYSICRRSYYEDTEGEEDCNDQKCEQAQWPGKGHAEWIEYRCNSRSDPRRTPLLVPAYPDKVDVLMIRIRCCLCCRDRMFHWKVTLEGEVMVVEVRNACARACPHLLRIHGSIG